MAANVIGANPLIGGERLHKQNLLVEGPRSIEVVHVQGCLENPFKLKYLIHIVVSPVFCTLVRDPSLLNEFTFFWWRSSKN